MTMMTVVIDGSKVEFESYNDYFKWDAERAKKEKEEKERKEREERKERAKKLANLTDKQKEEIDKLEEEIFFIKVSADFLSEKDYENINSNLMKIKKIRGF